MSLRESGPCFSITRFVRDEKLRPAELPRHLGGKNSDFRGTREMKSVFWVVNSSGSKEGIILLIPLPALLVYLDMIRLVQPSDAAGILAIYEPYIRDTSLTFETEVPAITSFSERINQYMENWPWLVWEDQGLITGYAYASKYRDRAGYQWSIECSVYISNDRFRSGIASQLYRTLFAILKEQGYRNVYAVINLPNDPSIHFHEKLGFRHFATYENVGYKLGRWKNVGWWQLQLNPYDHEPATPIALKKLDPSTVDQIIKSQTIGNP